MIPSDEGLPITLTLPPLHLNLDRIATTGVDVMFSPILRGLLFFVLIVLIVRFLHSVFAGRRKVSPAASPKHSISTVKDPICGLYLDPSLAFRMNYKNEAYYFCSAKCRKQFAGKVASA